MISYCLYKYIVEDSFDYGELALNMCFIGLTIILDILFLLFQPIFYIIVKKWCVDND